MVGTSFLTVVLCKVIGEECSDTCFFLKMERMSTCRIQEECVLCFQGSPAGVKENCFRRRSGYVHHGKGPRRVWLASQTACVDSLPSNLIRNNEFEGLAVEIFYIDNYLKPERAKLADDHICMGTNCC